VVLIAISFPELPLSTCTDVGWPDPDERPGGFGFYEFQFRILMRYSPDGGVNDCVTPVVTIAVTLLAIGSVIAGVDHWNQ